MTTPPTRIVLANGTITAELVTTPSAPNRRAEIAILDHDGNGSARYLSHADLIALARWIHGVTFWDGGAA